MYSRTHAVTVSDVTAQEVWAVWSDVNQWHRWQDDIEYARLDGPFATGSSFTFKPKGGPTLTLELTEVRPGQAFTDLTRFPLARMLDSHELRECDGQLEVRTTVTVSGPLALLWRKLVVEGIVRDLPAQTARLLERARHR